MFVKESTDVCFVFLKRALGIQEFADEDLVKSKASPLEPGEISIDSVAIPSSPTPNGTSEGKEISSQAA